MSGSPILKWEKLQGQFYRTLDGYPLQWHLKDLDLDRYMVSSAPYGGAIAVYKDPSKLQKYDPHDTNSKVIQIFSGSGVLLRRIPWENTVRIVSIGWSDEEHLVVVLATGIVRYYYDFDGNFTEISLGKLTEGNSVVSAQFAARSLVVLLSSNMFVFLSHYEDPVVRNFAIVGPSEDENTHQRPVIHSWSVVPPSYDGDQDIEVIAAVDSSVWSVTTRTAQDLLFGKGAFKYVSVSPNLQSIALLSSADDTLYVISRDGETTLSKARVSTDEPPKQLLWCGDDAVAVTAGDEILLFSAATGGSPISLFYESNVVAVQEIDGFRTITKDKHDFFTKVPDVTFSIFKLGSTAPGAILKDCVDHLEMKSPHAEENLLVIGDNLKVAVDACINAAGYEFEVAWQKKFMKAAAFGKSALNYYNSDKYVRMLEYLRVLNSVREFSIGMLMSYRQLIELDLMSLIKRLLLRNQHLLAFKIAELLRLPKHNIYTHWACSKVRVSQDEDEAVFQNIVGKLSNIPGISYEEVARTAFEEGRSELAIRLIDREPQPEKQVPLLFGMGEYGVALAEAEISADTNLIYYVLMSLRQRMSLADFFRYLNREEFSARCFVKLFKSDASKDLELLKSFYYQDDRRKETAQLKYEIALLNEKDNLQTMIANLRGAEKEFASVPGKEFESKAIAEQLRLITVQQDLERSYDRPFIGHSVSETISILISSGQNPRAQKLKDDFKVPEKRFWWIKLQALSSRRDWESLEKFAKSKRSPIGYLPFYQECLKAGSQKNAAVYVAMCTEVDSKTRIEMCIEVNDINQAVQEATKAKDSEALRNLKSLATPSIARDIDQALEHLRR